VWWEQTGKGEEARYALVALDKGLVSDIELHDLAEFVSSDPSATEIDSNFNPELLRHPAILENGTANSVDVLFGNVGMNTFHRATIKPIVAQGRIHIPIGRAPGHGVQGPRAYATLGPTGSRIDVIASNGKFLLYATEENAVNYLMYANGAWTGVRSVPVSEKLSADAAVDVLGRMINSNE
jgi:hypothetical protein